MPLNYRDQGRKAGLLALQLLALKAEHNSAEKLAEWQMDCAVAYRFTVQSLSEGGMPTSAITDWREGFQEYTGFAPD